MDRYIFLDCDGVIATEDSGYKLDPRPCELIQRLVNDLDCKIIITSSWRLGSLEDTIKYFSTVGHRVAFVPVWVSNIVGVTIRAYQYIDKSKKIHLGIPRGVEIKQWMDTHIHQDSNGYHKKIVGVDFQYVIFDDDSDMLFEHKDHFVRTDTYKGLQFKDYLEARRILTDIY